ncbi:hypothetical protein L596_010280 [Steinernema carpocapsae]|uniref:Uncharacterized protein n=1 Tax=Steinernema carpocapsae TaxID=34508 RepID=A0A4U5PIL4_STECR|nr:hypothetical protein L596_010280 [Steinernema carpocapsae]
MQATDDMIYAFQTFDHSLRVPLPHDRDPLDAICKNHLQATHAHSLSLRIVISGVLDNSGDYVDGSTEAFFEEDEVKTLLRDILKEGRRLRRVQEEMAEKLDSKLREAGKDSKCVVYIIEDVCAKP